MLPKLRRLLHRPIPLRLCPNCQQPTPLRAAVCAHCRQPLARLQPVLVRRSHTTIRPRSFREKFLTLDHPLNALLLYFLLSLCMFLSFGTMTITTLFGALGWQKLSSVVTYAVVSLLFGVITALLIWGMRQAMRPESELLYSDDDSQKWLDKLADKDPTE